MARATTSSLPVIHDGTDHGLHMTFAHRKHSRPH